METQSLFSISPSFFFFLPCYFIMLREKIGCIHLFIYFYEKSGTTFLPQVYQARDLPYLKSSTFRLLERLLCDNGFIISIFPLYLYLLFKKQ